ncbi:MAG TPA: 50S ribosomal protein L29 [Patescibacteria group bacterium]
MKINEKKSYREKTIKKLLSEIKEKNKKIVDLKLQSKINKIKNVKEATKLRKDIAVIKTIIREKEILERIKGGNQDIR